MATLRPRILYSFAFIMNSATGVLVVGLPLLGIRFGASALHLGLLGSAGAFVYALSCPFGGRLSDRSGRWRSGRRGSLIASCSLLVLVDCFIFFVSGLRDVFVIAVCGSFCTAFFWPPLQAWLAEIGGKERLAERLGFFNLSWSLGIMVGPMIGGFHVAALVRHKWERHAEQMLVSLAEANRQGTLYDWTFNEWLHGSSGHPMGFEQQAWSAAMFLYASHAVQTGKLALFDDLLAAKPAAAVAAESDEPILRPGGGPA
mgnify:CR=1 FL=1